MFGNTGKLIVLLFNNKYFDRINRRELSIIDRGIETPDEQFYENFEDTL